MKKPKVDSSNIKLDEWLRAIQDASNERIPPSNAVSVREFAERAGMGRSASQAKLRSLVQSGRARITKKLIMRASGAVYSVTAYLLVKDSKKC